MLKAALLSLLLTFGSPSPAQALAPNGNLGARGGRGPQTWGRAPPGAELRRRPGAAPTSGPARLLPSNRGAAPDDEAPGERPEFETRLYGLEPLYQRYRSYVSLLETTGELPALAMGTPRTVGVSLAVQPTLDDMRARLDAELHQAGFDDGLAGFETAISGDALDFERETVSLAQGRLAEAAFHLWAEARRYQRPPEAEALHQAIAKTGALADYEEADRIRDEHMSGLALGPEDIAEQSMWIGRRQAAVARGEAKLRALSDAHPLLVEADFPLERLAHASPDDVSAVMNEYISDRARDVDDTHESLEAHPEFVYGLDVLLQASLRAHGVRPGSIYDEIIRDEAREVRKREAIPQVVVAGAAVVAGLSTGGSGALPVLASGTAFGLGAYQTVEEFRRYERMSAAHGARLLSEEPTMAWVLLAGAGTGLDVAAFASAMGKLRPALEAFNVGPEAGNVAALEGRLAKLAEVDAALKQRILRAAQAEAEARAVWQTWLRRPATLQAVVTPGAGEFGRLVYAVFLTGKRGVYRFQVFVTTREAIALLGDVARLQGAELAAVKRGYLAAVKELEEIAAHGKALGLGDEELTAFMKLRGSGDAPSAAEVMKRMNAWKAARERAATTAVRGVVREPGVWVVENSKVVLNDATRYHTQITHAPPGYAYSVPHEATDTGRVHFDGFDGKVLQECKGEGYEQFLSPKGPEGLEWWFYESQVKGENGMLKQAKRQLEAAKGIPVRWYVAERRFADFLRNLFENKGLGEIEVVHVPLKR